MLIHPKVRLSTDRVSRHGIVFGKVGGGKTTIFLPVLAEILAKRHKAIIFDIKGDFTSKFWVKGGAAAILAPWDRRSLIWDIARDCRTRQDAARFAIYLIKDSKDPMWSAAARQLCVGFLVHLQMTRGESWGWKDLADLLATPEKELLAMMSEANPEAIRAVEQTGATTTGILINLSAFLSVIYDLAEAWPQRISGRMFSVQQWIFDEDAPHRAILLGGNKEFGPLMSAFAGALVAQAAACVCSPRLADSRTRRLYFVLDEFPQLGKVDIEPLVAVGRSKGARVWLGLQDFGQLKKLYGADEAQAITAMVGTLICAGAAPGETAKFISDMAGSREVERSSLSTSIQGGASAASTSHTWQRETIPVLTDSQASGLGPVPGTREIRALMLNFGNDALVLRWPFDTRPNIAKPVELAEWTLPTLAKRERAQERAELEAMQFLEGEELEESERRLAYARELAANRKLAASPPDFDPDAAQAGDGKGLGIKGHVLIPARTMRNIVSLAIPCQKRAERVAKKNKPIYKTLPDCSFPLIFRHDDQYVPYGMAGTGFLVMYDSKPFFITASHCLGTNRDQRNISVGRLSLPLSHSLDETLPLAEWGEAHATNKMPEGLLPDGAFDLAVIAVDDTRPEVAAAISKRAVHLPLTGDFFTKMEHELLKVMPGDMDKLVVEVMGFPSNDTQSGIDYDQQLITTEGVLLRGHIRWNSDFPHTKAIDFLDKHCPVKNLDGVSGAPVFLVLLDGSKFFYTLIGMMIRGADLKGHFITIPWLVKAVQGVLNSMPPKQG